MDLIPDTKVKNWAKGGIIHCSLYVYMLDRPLHMRYNDKCMFITFHANTVRAGRKLFPGFGGLIIFKIDDYRVQPTYKKTTIIFVSVFSIRSDDTVRIRPRRGVPRISRLKLYFGLSKHHTIRISDSIRPAF